MGTALVLAALSFAQSTTGLGAYVGRDLTKLPANDPFPKLARIAIDEKQVANTWSQPDPRWIKPYQVGAIRWLYLMIYPGLDVPDVSFVRAYGFDDNWKRVTRYEFPTGYRLRFAEEKLLQDSWISQPILKIKVVSVGPFMSVNGGPKRPAFAPADGIVEYYAFSEEGARLIGLEDGSGKLLANSYAATVPMIGQDTAGTPADRWRSDLNAADPVRQLGCLVWLAGAHLNAKDWRKENFSREPVAESKAYELLRSDGELKERIKQLATSRNPWLRKQAAFTLSSLSKPLNDISEPPW